MAKAELLRVVVTRGPGVPRLVPDPRSRLPGRGAYVHLDPVCLALAEKRRAFTRALRLSGPPDASAVRELLAPHDQHDQHG